MYYMYFYYNKTYGKMAIVENLGGKSYGNDNDAEDSCRTCGIR